MLDGVSPEQVRSLEVLLDAPSEQYRRVYNVEGQLTDGRTSISVEIAPAPEERFEIAVDVRAFDARDAAGALVASRAVTIQLEPNGCNDGEIALSSRVLPDGGLAKDAGGTDADPEADAGPVDADPRDADPIDADPIDADPVDADPIDADPVDADPMDADPVDNGAQDAGCPDDDGDFVCNPDDNCPQVPNPQQEDSDGVAAIPIPFAPIQVFGAPVSFSEDDDAVSQPVPIGFAFDFFGVSYDQIRVSTNGFFGFADPPNGCCQGQALPDPDQPNTLVALAWQDLWVENPLSVLIEFQLNRFVVQYDVRICCDPSEPVVNAQAILYEGTNVIEVHTTVQPADNGFTRGIESQMGMRAAFLPGEANASFPLSGSAVRYTTGSLPDGIGDACANAF